MECPFCGSDMRAGRVAVRTLDLLAPTSVVWKPTDGQRGEALQVFSAGALRRGTRPASYCYGCDAVVIDPPPPA
jgi:Domain of unknown function (DUF6487)